jgi:hypothetical protein
MRTLTSLLAAVLLGVLFSGGILGADSRPTAPAAAVQTSQTPAAILALARNAASPQNVATLRAAVSDLRPEVRAAAARAAWQARTADVVPSLIDALRSESGPYVAREQIRALGSVSGPGADDAIYSAWTRLGREFTVESGLVYAQARGVGAVDGLAAFRAAGADRSAQLSYVLVATRGEADALRALVARELAGERWDDLQVTFDAVDVARTTLPDDLVEQALTVRTASQPRIAALWHVLAQTTVPDTLKPAVAAAIAATAPARDDDAAIVSEFANRLIGRAPRTDAAWLQALGLPRPDLRTPLDPQFVMPGSGSAPWFLRRGVNTQLTAAELLAVSAVYPHADDVVLCAWAEVLCSPDSRPSSSRRAGPTTPPAPLMRIASNYPAGLVADVLAAAGCQTEKDNKKSITASVMLEADGRVTNVSNLIGKASSACVTAARALFAAYVPEPRTGGLPLTFTLVLPLGKRFVTCATSDRGMFTTGYLSTQTSERSPSSRVPMGGGVTMKAVVSVSGCVRDLEVLNSTHDALSWPAMRAALDGHVDVPRGRAMSGAMHAFIAVNYRDDNAGREPQPHPGNTYTPPWLEPLGYPAAGFSY